MSTASDSLSQLQSGPSNGVSAVPASAERWMTELHALLRELEAVTAASQTLPPVFSEAIDDRLVQARLGMAASLFAALQCKNAAVAGHALRVALTCSAWATKLELPEAERDAIEIAALLHDVGMIGAGRYSAEAGVVGRQRSRGDGPLPQDEPGDPPPQLRVAQDSGDRGKRAGMVRRQPAGKGDGRQIPLGARMIAIVEAFDAMTTDHVYRPARSQERAMAELFECSGTQFDPELVEQFDEFRRDDPTAMQWETAHRWLRLLDPTAAHSCWELNCNLLPPAEPAVDALFQDRLLDNMYDAVVFIDAAGRVVLWNRGAERLTGIQAAGIRGQTWQPDLLGLADEQGRDHQRAGMSRPHRHPLRGAIAAAADDRRAGPTARGRRRPRHSGRR